MNTGESLIYWLENQVRLGGELSVSRWFREQDWCSEALQAQIQNFLIELMEVKENTTQKTRVELLNLLQTNPSSNFPSIEPYQILAKLGEGGMGSVFLARHPKINRDVALKVIKKDLGSENLSKRFEMEYQALAQLKHPNLVRLLDVGQYEGGSFFTMDFYAGVSFDSFVDESDSGGEVILDLIYQACLGLEHAHGRGIIHRDLKPSNMLVVSNDSPRLVIIDFGIARALGQSAVLSEDPDQNIIVGTPGFMGPEQKNGDHLVANIQSDIFALGRVMRLLSLNRATSRRDIETYLDDMDSEPLRLASWLERMHSDWRRDWLAIAAKACSPGQRHRYLTVQGLIEDIQSLQKGFPVSARPWGFKEKIRRTVGRRPKVWLGVFSFSLVMVSSIVWGISAERSLRLAEKDRYLIEERLKMVRLLVDSTIQDLSPYAARPTTDIKDLLGEIGLQIEEKMDHFPEFQIETTKQLAQTHSALGDYLLALDLFQRARKQARTVYGVNHPLTIATKERMAKTLFDLHRLPEAASLYSELMTQKEALVSDKALQLRIITGQAIVLRTQGQLQHAKSLLWPYIDVENPEDFSDSAQLLDAQREWGNCLLAEGKTVEARDVFERVWSSQVKAFGATHLETLATQENIGLALFDLADYQAASENLEFVNLKRTEILGPIHPRTLRTLSHIGLVAFELGNYTKAEKFMEKAYLFQREIRGPYHLDTLRTAVNLARLYNAKKRYEEGEDLLQAVLDGAERTAGPTSQDAIRARNNLADNFLRQKKYSQSEAMLKLNLTMIRDTLGQDHFRFLATRCTLAELFMTQGDHQSAKPILEDIQDRGLRILPDSHSWHAVFSTLRGLNLLALGQFDKSEEQFDRAMALFGDRPSLYRDKAIDGLLRLHESWKPEQKPFWLNVRDGTVSGSGNNEGEKTISKD